MTVRSFFSGLWRGLDGLRKGLHLILLLVIFGLLLAVLRGSLETLGKRFGFINANLRLVGVDDSAIDLLYKASQEVCAYSEEGLRRIGFAPALPTPGDKTHSNGSLLPRGDGGVRILTPAQIAEQQQLFFDMRHVSRAFEQLGGESVRQFAE